MNGKSLRRRVRRTMRRLKDLLDSLGAPAPQPVPVPVPVRNRRPY